MVLGTGTSLVEALPVGNSRLGAMVYGGTDKEEIQLNEETFWAGGPYRNDNPKGKRFWLKHVSLCSLTVCRKRKVDR